MRVRQGDATQRERGRSADLDPAIRERVLAVVAAHRGDRGPLLPILHGLAAEFGCVDPAVVPLVADELNLSRADVHGVISFYRDFRREPAGHTVVRVCRAEACQSMGADLLIEQVCSRYGVAVGGTDAAREVTVDQVFCFGNCALSPAAEVAGELLGRATLARIEAAVGRHAADRTGSKPAHPDLARPAVEQSQVEQPQVQQVEGQDRS
jgi:formate dehydrogenase subunit gamma